MKKIFLVLCFIFSVGFAKHSEEKVLLCGICKDIEFTVDNTIENLEALASRFKDYAILIYENNSIDNTREILAQWAKKNKRVLFIGEDVSLLPLSRTEKIARARNKILSLAKKTQYKDFKYLIMIDLDFQSKLPIDEIVLSIESNIDWDCVCANGIDPDDNHYYDRYAFRNKQFPLGPELIGEQWWKELQQTKFQYSPDHEWIPVYSAFGGLAIYKTSTLLKFSYSGVVNAHLHSFYKKVLPSLSPKDHHLKAYLKCMGLSSFAIQFYRFLHRIGIKRFIKLDKIPIFFSENTFADHPKGFTTPTCCEHVPLHAAMILQGYEKIYINPKMVITRSLPEDAIKYLKKKKKENFRK